MPRTIEKTVYKYDELSDSAKQSAREWWNSRSHEDTFWSECVIDDYTTILEALGFSKIKVYFSGFWAQGDGACFESRYTYKKGWRKALPDHCNEPAILALGERLQAMQKARFYRLNGSTKHQGHYYHEFCTRISIEDDQGELTGKIDSEFSDICQSLMRLVYRALEREYEYYTSDDAVSESIIANDYEFDEHGSLAR